MSGDDLFDELSAALNTYDGLCNNENNALHK